MKVARDTLLGLVFFGGLGVLILATVFLTERVYGTTYSLPLVFDQALGLKTGDPVQVSGVHAGYVEKISLIPAGNGTDARRQRIRVDAALRETTRFDVFQDAEIYIEYASVLGGRVVAIDPGNPASGPQPWSDERPLEGKVRKDPLAGLSELIEENRAGVKKAVDEFGKTFEAANSGEGLVGRLLNDRELADRFARILEDIETVTSDLEQGKGTLGKLFREDKIANDIEAILADIKSVSEKLDRGEGTLGQLINNAEWASRLDRVLTNVEAFTAKLNSEDGTIGKLVNSPEAYDKLLKIEDSIQEFLDDLNGGKGWLARAITDEQLGEDVSAILKGAREIIETINRGEGTLGRLVKDDAFIRGLERVVRQISRSVEDAREAAPIATFSSVLFGAF